MSRKGFVRAVGKNYTREDLLKMEPVALGGLFRERVHHGIEVKFNQIIARNMPVPENFGYEARMILEVWRERGLSEKNPDIEWGKKYIEFADRLNKGEKVKPEELPSPPEPFKKEEMETVEKLIRERRSIREWEEKPVPGELIEKIMEAGRAAPLGCNLGVVRFIVLTSEEEISAITSDIPTPAGRCVIIVIGYDDRIYPAVGHDKIVPHNQVLDCAAAGDHMLLMAHALGLGGVWLTQTEKTSLRFKEKIGAPEYFQPVMHIALGWPANGTIKTERTPLKDMIIKIK